MAIAASMVKELREKTGACKKALAESNGDFQAAADFLRMRGLADDGKQSGRTTAEGQVGAYIHPGGRVGVLVEVNCETDFVARTEEFQGLVRSIGMQIAAMTPKWVTREEVPRDVVAHEDAMFRSQAVEKGKPESIVERMVAGQLENFFIENCLLEQIYVKDDARKQRVSEVLTEYRARLGENINIRRFSRFVLGEEPAFSE